MTITSGVQDQFFDKSTNKLICLPARSAYPPAANAPSGSPSSSPVNSSNGAPWTDDEHARFLAGLELFPSGPWKSIASCVGTRTSRQTMSHAQKYRQKIARRQRGIHPGGESDSGRNSPQEVDVSGHDSNLMCSDLVDASTMTECLSEMQLNNELLDEILMSLFEDDGAPLLITQEDMDAIMATH